MDRAQQMGDEADQAADLAEIVARVDAATAQHMSSAGTPGLVIALTDRERLLHTAVYGYADRAARLPVRPEARFAIGSIGKAFTSMALMQLHEAGRLDLHAPIQQYLPWFSVRTDYGPITAHHLLSHTAGIVTGTDFTPEAAYQVWALRETTTHCAPGTQFHYSNVGYKALGILLAELSGQPFEVAIRTALLGPLGMHATVAAITHDDRRYLAVGYEPPEDDLVAQPAGVLAPAPWVETNTADGSIAATAPDLAAFVRLLLNRGRGPRGRVISQESFALMTAPTIAMPGGGFYGYGLMSDIIDGHQYVWHDGSMIGYRSTMWADMDAGLGVVVLMNGPANPDDLATYTLQVLRAGCERRALPAMPAVADASRVEGAAAYAGVYRSGDRVWRLVAEDDRLMLEDGRVRQTVTRRRPGTDEFAISHPDYARYWVRFGRDADGRVVEAFHGRTGS